MSVEKYESMQPQANMMINEDGSVTLMDGSPIDFSTAIEKYKSYSPKANKFLMPDGSVKTLAEILPGGSGSNILPDRGTFDIVSGSVLTADFGRYYVVDWTPTQDMPSITPEVGLLTKMKDFDGDNGVRITFVTATGKTYERVKLTGGWEPWHRIGGEDKAFFGAGSEVNVNIGADGDDPSKINGLTVIKSDGGFTVDANDGKVKNETGRILKYCTGTISFQPDKTGGGVTLLNFWSERSLDGVTWTQNSNSLRSMEVSNSGETFKTSVSSVEDWNPNEYLRFRMYCVSGGPLNLVPPTDTVLSGESIKGYSVKWLLTEQ